MTIMQVQEAAAISGVTAIPWDRFTAGARVPQGPNDELVVWLGKLNQKMRVVRSARRLNLFKEALLESARTVAQAELRARQTERRQRWHALCSSWDMDNEKDEMDENEDLEDAVVGEPSSNSSSLCDCSSCIHCQRHQSQMFGKCYCHVIFSPIPIFMDFSLTPATDLFVDVDESREVDNFLASLGSGSGSPKRKSEEEEERGKGHKRSKA